MEIPNTEKDVEALSERLQATTLSDEGIDNGELCCVCQERSINAVELPCKHVFCYLCVKGVAARRGRCALCRAVIPPGYVDRPAVVNKGEIKSTIEQTNDSFYWFYEAKSGGWWMYEQRTSTEIEKAYVDGKKSLRLQISGFFYIVNLEEMLQYRQDVPSRRRKIKRDIVRTDSVKGVAGIHVEVERREQRSGSDREAEIEQKSEDIAPEGSHNVVTGRSNTVSGGATERSRLVTGFD